jgi:LDH2 family malate/lactate/ureidoglycolate dehydrogenase
VAVLLTHAAAGQKVALTLHTTGSALGTVASVSLIPLGHKIARRYIRTGELVRKYGRPIGRATRHIREGEHVHDHNLASLTRADPLESPEVVKSATWLRESLIALSEAGGMSPNVAADFADALWEANLRGVETHGVRRLQPYLERIAAGGVDPRAEPTVERRGALLLVDGRNGVGHHVAAVAADRAADLAREMGVSLALIRNSNHFGFAGYYATRIAAQGAIGLATSNGQVLIAPPGGLRALFSNNPLAIAAPRGEDDFMELDLATSVTSRAKIALAAQRGDPISEGLATDSDGNETTDASAALTGYLLPMGGEKGFALLFALEVLTGVLSGGAYADMVSSKESAPGAPEKVSQLVAAVHIETSIGCDVFERRFLDLIDRLRGTPVKADTQTPRYPGQRRWELRRRRLKDGVPLSIRDYQQLLNVGRSYGISLDEKTDRSE